MTNHDSNQNVEKKVVTRYGFFTRYESENESESSFDTENDSGNTKNFPEAFIPMRELEELTTEA